MRYPSDKSRSRNQAFRTFPEIKHSLAIEADRVGDLLGLLALTSRGERKPDTAHLLNWLVSDYLFETDEPERDRRIRRGRAAFEQLQRSEPTYGRQDGREEATAATAGQPLDKGLPPNVRGAGREGRPGKAAGPKRGSKGA